MKQSALLERLSKEKPAHEVDEIGEALRRGYSVQQIVKAMDTEMNKTEARKGRLSIHQHIKTLKYRIPMKHSECFADCCLIKVETRRKIAGLGVRHSLMRPKK